VPTRCAFTAADVLAPYVHRGAFENALADEDEEQDPSSAGFVTTDERGVQFSPVFAHQIQHQLFNKLVDK
jgi:hypothetical protein